MLKLIRNTKLSWKNKPAVIRRDPVPQKLLDKINVEHHGVLPQTFSSETNWTPIYKFPYLNACRLAIKFKLFVTGTSLGLCAIKLSDFILQNQVNLTSSGVLLLITTSGLLITGHFGRRVICHLYTTDDNQFIRISRLTFYGNRRDIVLPSHLVVPLADTNKTAKKALLYVKFRKPETIDDENDYAEFYDEKLYLSLVYGGLFDKPRFESIFGFILSRLE